MAGFTVTFATDRFLARMTNAAAPGAAFVQLDFPGDFGGVSDQWDGRYLDIDAVMVRLTTDATVQSRRPSLKTYTPVGGFTALRWPASTTQSASQDRRFQFSRDISITGLVGNIVIKEDLPSGLVVAQNQGALELEIINMQAGDIIQEVVIQGRIV